jgi:hypothetical protein
LKIQVHFSLIEKNLGNVIGQRKIREKVGPVPTFLLFALANSPSGKWASLTAL